MKGIPLYTYIYIYGLLVQVFVRGVFQRCVETTLDFQFFCCTSNLSNLSKTQKHVQVWYCILVYQIILAYHISCIKTYHSHPFNYGGVKHCWKNLLLSVAGLAFAPNAHQFAPSGDENSWLPVFPYNRLEWLARWSFPVQIQGVIHIGSHRLSEFRFITGNGHHTNSNGLLPQNGRNC